MCVHLQEAWNIEINVPDIESDAEVYMSPNCSCGCISILANAQQAIYLDNLLTISIEEFGLFLRSNIQLACLNPKERHLLKSLPQLQTCGIHNSSCSLFSLLFLRQVYKQSIRSEHFFL